MGQVARWIFVSAWAAALWVLGVLGTPAPAGATAARGAQPTTGADCSNWPHSPHCAVRSLPGTHAQPGTSQPALFDDDDDDDDDADDDVAVRLTPARLVQPRALANPLGTPPPVGERAVEAREHRRLVERPPNA